MYSFKMRSYWIEVDPKSYDWCPYKKTQRGEGLDKTEAETQVMQPQAKEAEECGQPP